MLVVSFRKQLLRLESDRQRDVVFHPRIRPDEDVVKRPAVHVGRSGHIGQALLAQAELVDHPNPAFERVCQYGFGRLVYFHGVFELSRVMAATLRTNSAGVKPKTAGHCLNVTDSADRSAYLFMDSMPWDIQ